jgi:hypothetical protein
MSDRGPGLQPERTALAWQRTGLAAAVTAALLLRSGLAHGSAFGLAASGCAFVVSALAWLTGRQARSTAPRPMMLGVTSLVCVTGILAVLQVPWTDRV